MGNKAERVFHHFEKISMIPRESGNEKAVSDMIAAWAADLGYPVIQDEFNNLVITKPASEGYEDSETVILQAHMDMVCEKTSESTHDFSKDPIITKVEGDWLVSACGTTLGADNGIGVSCALSVLEDKTLKHPELEIIFTTEEETTFNGVESISIDNFHGRRVLNLDHAADDEVLTGSCGGSGITFTLELPECPDAAPLIEASEVYTLKVSGMNGGHSGEDIHRGRGNANALLVQIIDNCNLPVVSIHGGTNRLAIARESEAEVLVADPASLGKFLQERQEALRKEYSDAAPDITLSLEKSDTPKPARLYDCRAAIKGMRVFPDGIMSMSGTFPGIVESSINMGVIELEGGSFKLLAEARGGFESSIQRIKEKVEAVAYLTGAEIEYFAKYSPWEYAVESVLRETAANTYKDMFGEDMKMLVVHAGLECGSFVEKADGFDAISIGPNCQYFHSPEERVSISSTEKFYGFLLQLLENLK